MCKTDPYRKALYQADAIVSELTPEIERGTDPAWVIDEIRRKIQELARVESEESK